MRKKADTITRSDGKTLSNKDDENDNRTKRVFIGNFKDGHHLIQNN